jgi:hypothetical protein
MLPKPERIQSIFWQAIEVCSFGRRFNRRLTGHATLEKLAGEIMVNQAAILPRHSKPDLFMFPFSLTSAIAPAP